MKQYQNLHQYNHYCFDSQSIARFVEILSVHYIGGGANTAQSSLSEAMYIIAGSRCFQRIEKSLFLAQITSSINHMINVLESFNFHPLTATLHTCIDYSFDLAL